METRNEHTLLIYAIVASIVTVWTSFDNIGNLNSFQIFLIIVVCCMWHSAGILVKLFKEAGRAMQSMPTLLIQPLITVIILLIFFIYWISIVALLATSSKLQLIVI